MSNITPVSSFDAVPRLETATPALAGPSGPMTAQAQALTNRDTFLKSETDAHTAVIGNTGIAADARNKLGLGDVVVGYNARGNWATATAYLVNDVVAQSSIAYQCIVAHTSGTFATDLAAAKWAVYQGARLADLAATNGDGLIGHGARTVKAVLDEQINVVSKGADPTGTTSSVAAFQAAIDATADATTQVIHVPRGIYKGDMSTLVLGTRTVLWAEEAGVSYPDQFPSGTRSTTRSLPPLLFGSGVDGARHLRQLGQRRAGAGAGAAPGSVTFSAGVITAIATGVGGTGYSTATTRVLVAGDGAGAIIAPVISAGVITGYTVTAGGTGYTTATIYVVDGPIVVMVGDSISTDDPTPSVPYANLWSHVRAAIQAANPLRNITFINRAVPSQTWTQLDQAASSNYPAWYSNTSKAWLDYVSELQPDLVIVALGMNDREDFVFSRAKSALAKLVAMVPRPDVVLATTPLPSKISATTNISGAAAQNGRHANAAYVRGMALSNGLGLLDFNRQAALVRDGVDVCTTALREVSGIGTQALPWTSPVTCFDYYLSATFSGLSGSWWTGRTLLWDIGTTGTNTLTRVLIEDNAGRIQLRLRDYSPGSGTYSDQFVQLTPVATPTSGTVEIVVSIQANRLEVLVAGALVYGGVVPRFGGAFAPVLSGGTTSPALVFYAGDPVQFPTRLTDYELWGYGSGGVFKGNALNHPTSIGVAHMFSPVVGACNWAANPVAFGRKSPGVTNYMGVNEPDPVAPLHVTKTGYSSDLNPIATASNAVFEDATSPGVSLLSGPSGVARIACGDSAAADQWVQSYNHSTDVWTEALGGVNMRQQFAGFNVWFVPQRMPSYTVAGLPPSVGPGALAHCTNETGGAVIVFFDGTNWRRVTDRAIAS